ncbi:MAG: glycosyl hydrolase [Lachnospiraceae bacterium]
MLNLKGKTLKILLLFVCMGFLCACENGASPDTGGALTVEDPKTYSWEEADCYEAEEGALLGGACEENRTQGYSGTGYVAGLANEGDGVKLTVEIAETGFYDLNFVSASQGGDYKENYVLIDGESAGTVEVQSDTFTDSVLQRVYLESGFHEIELTKYWGWIMFDRLLVKPSDELDPAMYQVSSKLINPNATENTQRLFSYLCDIYGTKILSGQYCDTGMYGAENAAIWKTTGGEYPAVLGLDLIEATPSRAAHGSENRATDYAIEYWENGGIVTFCWHWNAPEKYLTGQWYSGFYTEYTNIDLAKIMNGEDPEGYELLMQDIDAIAKELQKLQDAGVPVLWRPLHEASGGWFWWGASGPDAYKQLYILLYEKLTNEYGLNNLIWIWNGQDAEWYPGDEYVDIIGEDIYPGERVYSSQADTFLRAVNYTDSHKMVVMSENGCLFDPALAERDGAMWGFFCTWQGEFVVKNAALNDLSEQYTQADMVRQVYSDERVITRSELPNLAEYPIRTE